MGKKLRLSALVLVLAMLLCGCSGDSGVTVSVQSVSMITGYSGAVMPDKFAGIVESGETVKIEKDDELEILDIKVSAGDEVHAGQVLFTYNTDAISISLEKLQLELEQLNNSITTKKEQIAQLEKEKANAGSSGKLEYTLQIQELEIDISEAGFNVTAKEKEIERTKKVLANGNVTSPVNGCVQSVNESGNTDDFGNPLPFMTVSQTGEYRVKGTINEQSVGSLSEGCPVIIRSRTDENAFWSGTIQSIDWDNPISGNNNGYYVSYPTDEMTSSSKYPFYIVLDNSEGMMLGQHVYIEPDAGQYEQAAMMLPSAYIMDADSEPWVWAASSRDKLEKRSVSLGEYDEMMDSYPVLEGLAPEDYIAFPDDTCAVGAKVSYYDEASFEDYSEDVIYDEGEFVDEYVDESGEMFIEDAAINGDEMILGGAE